MKGFKNTLLIFFVMLLAFMFLSFIYNYMSKDLNEFKIILDQNYILF